MLDESTGCFKKFGNIWHENITETTQSNQMKFNRVNVELNKIYSCKFE